MTPPPEVGVPPETPPLPDAPLPATITLNAFTGDSAVSGDLAADAADWGTATRPLAQRKTLAPKAVDPGDWQDPAVGWGVVLAENAELSAADKAAGLDAPPPIRRLLAERGRIFASRGAQFAPQGIAPVLRAVPGNDQSLMRYYSDGTDQPLTIGVSEFGTERGRIPKFLLIVGSPAEVPWQVQFSLNRSQHVGRLDLPEAELANYVDALLSQWADMPAEPGTPLIWSTNVDAITASMQRLVGDFLTVRMATDPELAVTRRMDAAATCAALVADLAATRPAVIVTTSHGKTGPLGNADAMRATLGSPVDADHTTLDIDALLAAWQPAGAVWYSQACCSAGSNDGTSYTGLLQSNSTAFKVVDAVGKLGAAVAPLPTRLLGAQKPLRAFIGHVEPTFDWTLIEPTNGQPLTMPLVNSMYPNLFLRQRIGQALDSHYRGVGELYARYAKARREVDAFTPGAGDRATYALLTAIDRQSLVILGDPTVTIPLLPSQR
ncbi:hypothetical protein JK358_36025 [Nocardia sp. 2]|uniref:Uncharacterized protein n=1 Tax=Nocardia acididurans TaxID=2802282 RepID=A0ABS1MIE8_9NOCA|nr:hypothetical protein [Nocardia acididurans]MBL1079825.1 hypothetical protein [Nocardia acididurans]